MFKERAMNKATKYSLITTAVVVVIAVVIVVVVLTTKKHKKKHVLVIGPSPVFNLSPSTMLPSIAINTPSTPSSKPPVRLWLSTYTNVKSANAVQFYGAVLKFMAAFNTKFASENVQCVGMYVNLVPTSVLDLAAIAAVAPLDVALGAVMAPAPPVDNQPIIDPTAMMNMLYAANAAAKRNAYTMINFDSETIGTSVANSRAYISTPAVLNSLNSTGGAAITNVSVIGSKSFTGDALRGLPAPYNTRVSVTGIAELYSMDEDCVDPSCAAPPLAAVLANWQAGSRGIPGVCLSSSTFQNFFQNGAASSWPALSCENICATQDCLISALIPGAACNAGGTQSFAPYTLSDFVGFMSSLASLHSAPPVLNIMLYETAFLPMAWFKELGINTV
jgi:hypothetical protein